jgi:hypothetical protein
LLLFVLKDGFVHHFILKIHFSSLDSFSVEYFTSVFLASSRSFASRAAAAASAIRRLFSFLRIQKMFSSMISMPKISK